MVRKTLSDKEGKLLHKVNLRITEEAFQWLSQIVRDGDCNSVSEAIRRIISGDKISVFYIDDSLNFSMQRLCEIRSELRDTGMYIRRVSKCLDSGSALDVRLIHSLDILQQYNGVGKRVDELLLIVSEMSKKWLHV